jgi:hypothetical protein
MGGGLSLVISTCSGSVSAADAEEDELEVDPEEAAEIRALSVKLEGAAGVKVDGQAALQVGHFQSPCVDRCASMFTSVERSNV